MLNNKHFEEQNSMNLLIKDKHKLAIEIFYKLANVRGWTSTMSHQVMFAIEKCANEFFQDNLNWLKQNENIKKEKIGIDYFENEDNLSLSAKVMTTQSLETSQGAIEASVIIFSHSLIDGIIWDLLCLTAICEPMSWQSKMGNKNISIKQLINPGFEIAFKYKLNDYLNEIERKPLIEKVNLYLSIISPDMDLKLDNGYSFSIKDLTKYDRLRHELVHKLDIKGPILEAGKAVDCFNNSATILLNLALEKYGIKFGQAIIEDTFKE